MKVKNVFKYFKHFNFSKFRQRALCIHITILQIQFIVHVLRRIRCVRLLTSERSSGKNERFGLMFRKLHTGFLLLSFTAEILFFNFTIFTALLP